MTEKEKELRSLIAKVRCDDGIDSDQAIQRVILTVLNYFPELAKERGYVKQRRKKPNLRCNSCGLYMSKPPESYCSFCGKACHSDCLTKVYTHSTEHYSAAVCADSGTYSTPHYTYLCDKCAKKDGSK